MLQKILIVLVQVKKFVALTQLQPKQLSDKSNTLQKLDKHAIINRRMAIPENWIDPRYIKI